MLEEHFDFYNPFWIESTEPVVVECKDCKYGEQCIPPCDERYCVMYDRRHPGWWYCADGERRTDDE